MPTKKVPRARPWRPAWLSPETLSLFAELEDMHKGHAEYKTKSRRLHVELLDLGYEWFCGCCNVNDSRSQPGYLESSPHFDGWLRVRATRQMLLEALARDRDQAEEVRERC